MLTLQQVNITDIAPNAYNPNVVDEKTMLQLKKSILRDGYIQPIVVRPNPEQPGKFIIVDGEHRWTILQEIGGYDILDVVVVDKQEHEAMIETVNMNNLRGTFDNFRLAEVVLGLTKRYSEEELEDMLGYSKTELQAFQDLATFDFSQMTKPKKEEDVDEEPEEKALFFTVMVNQDQIETVKAALAKKSFLTEALSLTSICADWLSNNDPDEYLKLEMSGTIGKALANAEDPARPQNATDIIS